MNKFLEIDGTFSCTESAGEGFSLSITSEQATIHSAAVEMDFDFQKKDIVFLNGYQSWTLSRERKFKDYDPSMRFCPKKLDETYGFSAYGDGLFYPKKYKKGIQHGYSYAYVRRGDTYFFFGSLAENTGFTRIIFDAKHKKIRFEKDAEGRVVKGDYKLFDLYFKTGTEDEVFDGWFEAMGVKPITLNKLTGYTSWYNYYQNISESILFRDIDAMNTLKTKPDLFQIDDGYETKVGDWLSIDKEKFPNGLEGIVKKIKENGYHAGIWLAPFVAEKESALIQEHPEWFVRHSTDDSMVYGGSNWSGMYALDFYNEEVQSYVRRSIEFYKEMGFELFKLDFLYAVCMIPRPDKTRGEIMEDAMNFLRDVCGECAILGCGVPLASAFGKVEFCRIGMDMTLDWNDVFYMHFFHAERPSTKHTMLNTLYRRQLSGRAFLNDPDVFLLREENTKLSKQKKEVLAKLNCLLGGVLFTSDNYQTYSEETKKFYEDAISLRSAHFLGTIEEEGRITVFYDRGDKVESFEWKLSGKDV